MVNSNHMTDPYALIVSIFSAGIALGAMLVARQQKHLAKEKLKHDLFDRRYRVYEAARQFIGQTSNEKISKEDMLAFHVGTVTAPFLFGPEVAAYLKTLKVTVARHQGRSTQMQRHPGDPNLPQIFDKHLETMDWLFAQHDAITEIFLPYLGFDLPSPPQNPLARAFYEIFLSPTGDCPSSMAPHPKV